MKLLLAIVNNDDANAVNSGLSRAGFSVTRIATTGGFLMTGNTTFLVGVSDGDVDKVSDIIRTNSKKRVQKIPFEWDGSGTQPAGTVTVGGATVFVLNVEECRHL